MCTPKPPVSWFVKCLFPLGESTLAAWLRFSGAIWISSTDLLNRNDVTLSHFSLEEKDQHTVFKLCLLATKNCHFTHISCRERLDGGKRGRGGGGVGRQSIYNMKICLSLVQEMLQCKNAWKDLVLQNQDPYSYRKQW